MIGRAEIIGGTKIGIDEYMADWRKLFCGQHAPHKFSKLNANIVDLRRVLRTEDSLLDVGCNTGEMYRVLGHQNYTGIDFDLHYIETARGAFPNVPFHCQDLFDLSGLWDVVLCSRVLIHVAPFNEAMKRLIAAANRYLVIFAPVASEDCCEKIRFEKDILYFRRFSEHAFRAYGQCEIIKHHPYSTIIYIAEPK